MMRPEEEALHVVIAALLFFILLTGAWAILYGLCQLAPVWFWLSEGLLVGAWWWHRSTREAPVVREIGWEEV